ncbi:MAG TPA: DNA polymerase domain-containing protein [Thermoplasmata archaeon]
MGTGWLLDITDDPGGSGVILWLKDAATRKVAGRYAEFRPPFLVTGPAKALSELRPKVAARSDVAEVAAETQRVSILEERSRRTLVVTARRNPGRRRVADAIDALGSYHTFQLYDVDLGAPQLYHLTHALHPFAAVVWDDRRVRATDAAEAIDYTATPLNGSVLEVRLAGHRRGRVAPRDGTIAAVRLGDAVIEGDELDVLLEFHRELVRQDPDILFTDGGDSFDLPWLSKRALALGLAPATFYLGRVPAPIAPLRPARSYESYGQVVHRDASFLLPGRFHLDRGNSFLFGDAAVDGLVDAARLSRLSLQTVVRQSPGTCFTAMEMAHALALGVHVPFKKNRPEEFKSARTLVAADRGGVIFLPPVGVFDLVDEFDFASLYPHIMVRKNLSIETLDCRCCPDSPVVAPGLGYRSCRRRIGLIPRTLAPLLARRLAYKARLKDRSLPPAEAERLRRRVKMLKWILVTAFGYQGYRNARFGRIECHEAINAYARELIARLVPSAESAGYRVLHGLVDSLWLTPADRSRIPDPVEFADRTTRTFDLPLGYEGRYRWVVFLPAVTHGLGVPNRYYGLYESGELKLRGIGSRRHDTATVFRRFEAEALEMLARSRDAEGVRRSIPRVLARADLFAEALKEGTWPREELLVTHRLSQPTEEYVVFTESVAAIRQLAHLGASRDPGESVRFLLRDRSARSWRDRVTVAEALAGDEPYDVPAYLDGLARSAETLLAPFGVTRTGLLDRWSVGPPRPRSRYTSAESLAQRVLADRVECL